MMLAAVQSAGLKRRKPMKRTKLDVGESKTFSTTLSVMGYDLPMRY
jgi:hypothetical protein